ncbi:TonB-dependent receptor plug domain-containing protein, partial [uncultured Herbaspirillum sp.]
MMTRTLRKPSSCPPASLPQRLMVRSLRLALLGLSVSAPAWAQAQTQTTTSDSALPQVTVTAGQQEQATGPVHGFVAKRSATATKTDTPITEIPQSISVVTADQIAAQQARSVSEALGYTSGVQV